MNMHGAGTSGMADLARLSRIELERMAACGRELADARRVLALTGDSVVSAALSGAPGFRAWQHYPEHDVCDPVTHAQYFYHAHAEGERPGEHGHFHTFLRERGMPEGVRPLVLPELAIADAPAAPLRVPSAPQALPGEAEDSWCHLVAIAMDAEGRALRLFTTNRWVTGETWYPAADAAAMLGRFAIVGGGAPPAPLNRWITAMIGLFRPEIAALLEARDAAVMGWRRRRRGKVHVFEDRRLEITSSLDIDVDAQRQRVEAALRRVA
jgi:hypothetical protein